MFAQLMNKHADFMGNLSHGRFDHDVSHSVHYTLVTELQCCYLFFAHVCLHICYQKLTKSVAAKVHRWFIY